MNTLHMPRYAQNEWYFEGDILKCFILGEYFPTYLLHPNHDFLIQHFSSEPVISHYMNQWWPILLNNISAM